ncbi:MAG: preprotein translocase subunit SecF [Bacillota bacterium]|nr:MAG: preprotein translocase subunit SecF [Bacillota bacterium]MBS3950121.1 protein translocase subunit SecF [Peptococcaceae bacterium]
MKFNLNIIGKRKQFYYVSVVFIVFGIGLLLFRGLNFGVDFRSGSLLEVDLKTVYTTGEVQQTVSPHIERLQIRDIREGSGQRTRVEIRTTNIDNESINAALESLQEKWPEAELVSTARVDATFSGVLVRNAIYALILASIGMLIYIAIRFEHKFAVAAVIALLHDVFVVIIFFALFRIEVNSEFIAAILTIVGYSVNDTMVVFDRIRENLVKAKRHADMEELVNRSVNESIVRAINTSVSTLLVVGSVFIFGGITLRPLAIALVIGLIAGVYSTIFIASSIWVDWKNAENKARLNTKRT